MERAFGTFFGEPWPSGICDEGIQVTTPVGERCEMCNELIEADQQGSFVGALDGHLAPVHRECSLRAVLGGIGHLTNHLFWCQERRDPDAGFSYRQSALKVWDRVNRDGLTSNLGEVN